MSEGPVLSRQRFARTLAEQGQATPGEIPEQRRSFVGNVRMKRRHAAPEPVPDFDTFEAEDDAAVARAAEQRSRDAGRKMIQISVPDRRFFLTTEFWMVLVSAAAAFAAERWGIDPDMLTNVFYGLVALAIGRQGQKALRGMQDK